jgi:RNA polymerase sigma-70 factor
VSGAFDDLVREKYRSALAVNGDLGVDYPSFAAHLRQIVVRCFPDGAATQTSLTDFLESLYTSDLLLALACSRSSNAAWQRFSTLYRNYVTELGRRLIGSDRDTHELADAIWFDLFLPDHSGQSRIASYHGRSSLATWLRVIVTNRVINERVRRRADFCGLDGIPELPDPGAEHEMEHRLRFNRYHSPLLRCFRQASLWLSPYERTLLLLRYDQGLKLGKIALRFSVHQATITRQIDRAVAKLRAGVVSSLATHYGLGPDAIEECLTVAFESLSGSPSILTLLKSAGKPEHPAAAAQSMSPGEI